MSKQVDERVVSMEFDNSRFEKNVSTTMSTLDKLKQKLNLTGAAKGLEDIDAASKKVNMSALGSAVDTVKAKFSAMDVVAVTALANITNSAVNAGKKLVSSLSVDQITAGWSKFSDKTTSVATLVAQGNAIEDVTDQLDRLNWFTDETSYNFTDMVSNIAKFTATGKDLGESVTAMEGIATWAALSGQNASTASRAMYQLSQAMGAGVMRLEDYKSIQNASMDTEEFRQKCLDAAISLGTLKKNSDGTYQSIVEGASDTSFEIAQFARNLTDGMWLTSDVMMKVFNEYSSAVDGIYEAAEKRGMLASEVIDEIHDTVEKKGISTDEAIKSLGYDFDSFALKAFEAAQKARTFRDAIDSVKDAVSTGWMNTFEIVFGNAEQATKLWTDVANQLWDIFAGGGETRNEILTDVMGSKWDQLVEKINDAGVSTEDFQTMLTKTAKEHNIAIDDLIKEYGSLSAVISAGKLSKGVIIETIKKLSNTFTKTSEAVSVTTDKLEHFQGLVNKVIRGDFGNGADRVNALTKAGENAAAVQTLVNKVWERSGHTWSDTTITAEDLAEVIGDLSESELESIGYTEEEAKALKELAKEAEKTGTPINELIESLDKPSGQELVFDIIHNSLAALSKVISTFREAWGEIFTSDRIANGLYNALSAVQRASENLVNYLDKNGDKLKSTFKGVIAILDILVSIVGGALNAAFEILGEIFGNTNTSILDITGNAGDAIVAFRDWIAENNLITKGFKKLVGIAKKFIKTIKKWIDAFADIPVISDLLDDIKSLFSGINDNADSGSDKIESWVGSFDGLRVIGDILDKIGKAFEWIGGIVEKAITAFGEWFETFKQTEGVQELVTAVTDLFTAFSKLLSGELDANEFATQMGKSFGEILASIPKIAWQIGSDFIQGFTNGLSDGIGGVIEDILEFCGNFISAFAKALGIHSPSVIAHDYGVNWVQGFINGISSMLEPLMTALQPIIDAVKKVFSSFWDYITDDTGGVEWDKIVAGGITIETLVILKKFADSFQTFANSLTSFTSIFSGVTKVLTQFSKVLNGVSWDLKAKAVLKMAIAVGIMAAAVYALAQIDDYGKLWSAVGAIVVLAGVLTLLTFAVNQLGNASIKFNANKKKLDIDGLKSTILQLGAALLMLGIVVKIIGDMSPEQATQGLRGLLAIAGGMIVFLALMGLISRYSYAADVESFGKLMTKLAWAMLLMVGVIKMVSWLSGGEMVKGTAFMAGFAIFVIAIGAVAKNCGEHVSKFGTMMIKLAIAMGLLVGVCKLINTLSTEEAFKGAAFAAAFTLLVWALVKVTTIGNEQKIAEVGNVIFAVGAAMLLMAAACKIVSSLSWGEIYKGLTCVSGFGLIIAALIALLKIGNEQKMGKVASSLIGASIAILIMAGAAVILGMIPMEDLWKGVAAVTVLGLVMAAMIHGLKGANDVKGSITAMTVAIGLIAGSIIALSFVDDKDLATATAAMGTLMGLFAVMIKSLKGLKKIKGVIGNLYAMLGVVAILAGLVIALSWAIKDPKSAIGAVGALSALMLSMAGLLKLLHGINYSKNDINKIWNLTAMAVPLAAFAAILWALDALKVETSTKTVITLVALMAAMVGLLKLLHGINYSKNDINKIWNLTAMAVPLAAFAAILWALDALKVETSTKTVITLVALMAAMAGLLFVLNMMSVDTKTAMKGILALTAMAVPLVAFAAVLLLMGNVQNAITNAIALAGLATVCTLLLIPLTLIGSFGQSGAPYLGALALLAMAVPLVAFAGILMLMDNVQNAVTNAIVLAALATACTLLLIPLTLIGAAGMAGLPYLGALALLAMAVPLVAFAGILMLMDNVQNAITNAIALTVLATACSLLLIPLTLIGAAGMAGLPFIGMLALLAMAVPMLAFVGILAVMDKVKNATTNAELLIGLMTALTDMLVKLSLVAPLTVIGVAAMGGLTILIGAIGTMALALGALMDTFPSVETFLNKGLPMLEKLAGSIGTMIGTFIGNIGEALGDSLVKIGEDIAEFMDKLAKASESASTIKGESFDGIKSLMAVLLEIGGSSIGTGVMDKISNFLSGKDSIDKFVSDAKKFFEGMKEAMSPLNGVAFNEEGLDCILKFAVKLAAITDEIGGATVWSSVTDFFTFGGTSMEKFGKDAKEFFSGMKTAMSEINGATFNEEGLDCVMDFAERLAAFESHLDGMYGFISWVTGRSDLDIFRKNAGEFFSSMRDAMNELDGVTFNRDGLDCVMDFAERLAAFESHLDGLYGFMAWITGRSDLDIFRQNAKEFFNSMKETMQSLDNVTFNEEGLNYLMDFAERIAAFQSSLDGMYGFMAWCFGLTDLDLFRYNATQFFDSMKDMMSSLDNVYFNVESLNYLMDFAERIAALQSSLDGMRSFMTWCTGLTDITVFGDNAKAFIDAMKTAMSSLDGVTFNEEALTSVITAAERLADLQSKLEPIGGVVTWFNGRSDLGTFGERIGLFAEAMGKLSTSVGENGISSDVVSSMTNAGNALIELQKALPEENWFDGKMNLSEFSKYITDFATSISQFSEVANGIEQTAVTTAIDTANKIKDLIVSLVGLDTSGLTAFTGIGTGGFGADGAAYKIAKTMSTYGAEVAGINCAAVSTSVSAATQLKLLIASLVGLDTSGIENFKIDSIGSKMAAYAETVAGINVETVSGSVTAANRLSTLISNLAGLDPSGVNNFKISSIGSSLSSYSASVVTCDWAAVTSSIRSANELRVFVANLAKLDTSGVGSFSSAIDRLSSVNVNGIVEAFSGASEKMANVGSGLMDGLITGIETRSGAAKSTIAGVLSGLVDRVKTNALAFFGVGETIMTRLAAGVSGKKSEVSNTMSTVLTACATKVREKYDSFYSAGSYLVDGLANGISENQFKVTARVTAMAQAALDAARAIFQIHSPSKATYSIGEFLISGFANGITDSTSLGTNAVSNFSTGILGDLKGSLGGALDGIDLGSISLDDLASKLDGSGIDLNGILSKLGLSDETLSMWDEDKEAVKEMQTQLEELGYSVGQWGIDGEFGPDTLAALQNFCKDFGLEVENFASSDALSLLEQKVNSVEHKLEGTFGDLAKVGDEFKDPTFSNAFNDYATYMSGISLAMDDVNKHSELMTKIANEIDKTIKKHQAIPKFFEELGEKISGAFNPADRSTIQSVIDTNLDSLDKATPDFEAAGENNVEGYVTSLMNGETDAYNAGFNLGSSAVAGVNAGQDSHSPSRETMKSGKWLGEGLIIGIKRMGNSVYNASENMGQEATTGVSSAMSAILDALSSDMDAQPTIRPVVDLSEVKTGANAISGMFAGTQSIGVQSNLSAINLAMNRKLQNGTNDDIISAINKLNDGLDGNRGDTYNFAGITYDNGNEISEAVQTLVRAAKMGRRV